ncbi:MAG TPA: substrate-binding domain-containing protein [Gemmatimonadaceae bacterium]|nr:substrate-binding domain-containing protein [Gemmatimonadaceae bacterium]
MTRMRWSHLRLTGLAALAALGAVALGAAPGARAGGRAPKTFRVCADPNNLPFSNRRGEGFENRIAELFARDLHATLAYDWLAQNRGFARKTLKTGACDVIMGVPAHYDPVLTTIPYYRSTYVFVTRASDGLRISSFDDPRLAHLKIGVHLVGDDGVNPPPAMALGARGIVDNVEGYPLIGDYSKPNPPARLLDAVAARKVDVAVVWGPLAGYFAGREPTKLTLTPVRPAVDATGLRFSYAIAMGVRKGDTALKATLDSLITRERPAIQRILDAYGVPHADSDSVAAASAAP